MANKTRKAENRLAQGNFVSPSPQQIIDAMTPAGAWTAATLASWGVPWPPPRGWRRELEEKYALDDDEQDKLFPVPKKRKANKNPGTPADEATIPLVLRKSERQALHVYASKAGAQDLVRILIEHMDAHPKTGNNRWHLDLDRDLTWRLVRTIITSGEGGPNNALRTAFHRYFRNGEGW